MLSRIDHNYLTVLYDVRIVLDIVACHAEASAPPAQVTTLHIRFGSGPVPILVTDRKRHQTVVYAQPPHVIDVCERPWVPPAALVPIAAVSVPVHTQKRVDPPDHWEENVLPVVLQCCWEWIEFTLANPDAVSPLVVVWDVDETVALTVVIALLCAFFDVGLTPLDWVVATGPPLPVSKDTVKRMYAALQQRCPACPIVPRRLVKLLNSYYTDPVSSWHRWRICHLKT